MNIETIKNFVMNHKKEVIGGTIATISAAALAVLGVKCCKRKTNKFVDSLDPEFLDLLDTIDRFEERCTHYIKADPKEIWAMFDNDGNMIDPCITDVDGNILHVDNIIAFGHEIKSEP